MRHLIQFAIGMVYAAGLVAVALHYGTIAAMIFALAINASTNALVAWLSRMSRKPTVAAAPARVVKPAPAAFERDCVHCGARFAYTLADVKLQGTIACPGCKRWNTHSRPDLYGVQ